MPQVATMEAHTFSASQADSYQRLRSKYKQIYKNSHEKVVEKSLSFAGNEGRIWLFIGNCLQEKPFDSWYIYGVDEDGRLQLREDVLIMLR